MSVADFGMVITESIGVESGASGSDELQTAATGGQSSMEPMEVVEVPVQAESQDGSTQFDMPQTIAIQPNCQA